MPNRTYLKIFCISLYLCLQCSLHVKASVTSNDTTTVNQLNKTAEANTKYNPAKAYDYAMKSIGLARKLNYDTGLASGLLLAARINITKGDSVVASMQLNESILLYQKLGNKKGLADCYLSYGNMDNTIGNYHLAFLYATKALTLFTKVEDQASITECYKQIGIIYYSQGNLSNALDYYYKALFMAVNTHNTLLIAKLYDDIGIILQDLQAYPSALEYFNKSAATFEKTNNLVALGIVYEDIAEVLLAQGELKQALSYLNKAYFINKKENDPDGLSAVYANMGLYYHYSGQSRKGISYLDTALDISVKNKMIYDQSFALISLAKVYDDEKKYQEAYLNAVQGYQLSKKLGNIYLRLTSTLQLKKTLDGLGRVDEAYKKLDEYFYIKDGSENQQSMQRLTDHNLQLNFNYDRLIFEQQQREKNLQSTQKSRLQTYTNAIYVIIIAALTIIIGFFYLHQRRQQKMNALLKENNLLINHQKNDLDTHAQNLDDLNKMKDRLIGVMAHDLRAPLSTLTGLFDLLQDDSINHDELLKMIPKVLSNLKYTSDFLDTLLYWINSQMENFQKAASYFCLNQTLFNECELLHAQFTEKNIALNIKVADNLGVFADPDSIRIVIRNLLTNAIKYSHKDSTIEIFTKIDNEHVTLSIKHHGIELCQSVFAGRVVNGSGTLFESGTGMGLIFCNDLIENNKGKIWVESTPNESSVFSISLPAIAS
jgi:two-component system, sensor histidine kinase and response regulator